MLQLPFTFEERTSDLNNQYHIWYLAIVRSPLETLFDFVLSAAGFDILFTAQLSYFVVVHKGNQCAAGKLFQCKKSGFRSQFGKDQLIQFFGP